MMSLARPAVDANNNPLGFNYTASQVDAALRMIGTGSRTLLFRFNLLDLNNKLKKQLSTVMGGSVTYDYTQQIKRTAQFDLMEDSDINYLSDRIQPFALLRIPSSGMSTDGTNVAPGTTYTLNSTPAPSSSYPDDGKKFVDDSPTGNYSSTYGIGFSDPSATVTADFTVDLGSVKYVGEAVLTGGGGQSGYKPDSVEILVSEDGQTFTAVGTSSSYVNTWELHVPAKTSARYVRFHVVKQCGTSASGTDWMFVNAGQVFTLGAGGYAQFPLGVFLLSTAPQQTDDALVVTRSVQGYDLNQILVDWKTTDRYTIAAGTNYISAISSLLSTAGINQTNLTSTTLTLKTALDYPGGTPYLTIINDLLTQIVYKTLWFDENGVAVAEPWVSPSVQTPGYTYKDDSNSVILPQVNANYDLFSIPNVWVVVVAQTDQAEIVSTYTNSNSASPTSTTNRGRQIVHFEQNLNAPLSQTLDSFAARLAFQDSQVYETVVYESAIMPFHQDYDVVKLEFSTLSISDNYSEQGWTFPFQAGGTMSHTIRRIVPV